MTDRGEGRARYAAFLSYSHKDAAAARWLHRRLETYRMPRRLVGTEGERGSVPARLTPIFRDREELPAAGDLSEKVRAALAVSDNLVIVCSPNSSASPWVAREIAVFRELHLGRPVFAAIVDGEPGQCFPAELSTGGIEPLAADLRPGRDGRRLGFLKLVAGLTGVGLDALVQRDAQRRLRRVTAVTATALAAMLMMAVLTAFALSARSEAQRQRAQAEGLVEFMLTDLREKLKGVAGLQVLTAANQRALDYYRDQDLGGLPAESLERRARILHAMGEDDMARNQLGRALERFEEAALTTSRLLREGRANPERIFAHAQSEFWIGHVAFRRKNFKRAGEAFGRYRALAGKLIAHDATNPQWRAEVAFAEGNLCSVALEQDKLDFALSSCSSSVENMRRAASDDPNLLPSLANRFGWLADVYRDRGDRSRAWRVREEQEQLLRRLLADEPKHFDLNEMWLTNQLSMGELAMARGARSAAEGRLQGAFEIAERLVSEDSTNKHWASRKRRIARNLEHLRRKGG